LCLWILIESFRNEHEHVPQKRIREAPLAG
jgi:hypothetical protein